MICSSCGKEHDRTGQRYCAACHAAYMRLWRVSSPVNEEQKRRGTSRAIARVSKRRGALAPQPCEACGSSDSQMHHQDHERPLDVTWLCRACHLAWHTFWRNVSRVTFQNWLSDQQAVRPDRREVA